MIKITVSFLERRVKLKEEWYYKNIRVEKKKLLKEERHYKRSPNKRRVFFKVESFKKKSRTKRRPALKEECYWQAQGFPFVVSHQSIIEAVGQATKCFPVPLRSYKASGMITWILAFQDIPQIAAFEMTRFSKSFFPPKKVFQETVREQSQSGQQGDPQQNGKSRQTGNQSFVANASSFQAQTTVKRLDDLESKVAKLETAEPIVRKGGHLCRLVNPKEGELKDNLA